jgi:hypothetical protein
MDNGLLQLVVILYFICHSPAFLLLIIGAFKRKNSPETAKTLFIAAGTYFLIGGGVCGALLGMLGGL